jgi:hypothetical protein
MSSRRGGFFVPDRLRPLLVALAVLTLAGCGGGEPEATSTPVAPSTFPSSTTPSSASPTPTPSSAGPSSPTASPTPSWTRSASPASDENGTYANELSLSEDGALSYVPLRWYSGSDAEARCAEKDVKPEGAFCEEYYYEKAGGRKSAALTEATKVRLLNDDAKPANASLTDLVQAIEDEAWPNFQIATSGERVTQITQVFTP